MRAIVIADGDGTRWRNHLGVPKHLIPFLGEPLVHRTGRQLREAGFETFIVGPAGDDRYRVGGCALAESGPRVPEWHDASKFLDSQYLWSETRRTVVVYGDVFFDDEAVDAIASYDEREWRLFARLDGSPVTGTRWGECFAQSFWPEHIDAHRAAFDVILEARAAGRIRRCGGWEHYRAMCGLDPARHAAGDRLIEVGGWTDDFDFPQDYATWVARRIMKGLPV